VQSRTGLVSLKNLRLDCDVLNQFMAASPLRIIDSEVGELQASISYDAILADGCNVTCKGLVVVMAPASSSDSLPHATASSSRRDTDSKREPPKKEKKKSYSQPASFGMGAISEEDHVSDDSLGFIAQWIEVIIARLRITVEDLHIVLLDSPSVETSAAAIHIKFSNFTFYNSHPRLVQETGSSVMATSVMGGSLDASSSFIDALNTRKVPHTHASLHHW
jgi:hypothetical protein